VFVPAYNAARHLPAMIERVPSDAWKQVGAVWIIDDGSTDGTAGVAGAITAQNPRCRVERFEVNRGYGAVVKKGLSLCRADGCEIAVCLHGDGQYPPEALPEGIAAIRGGLDLVQGSRIASHTALSGGMPLYKYVAGRTLTFFENLVFGLRMTDYHSGYLFYSRRALETLPYERLSAGFDIDLELIAAARAHGLNVGEIPVQTHYGDEVSHLNPVGYGLRVLRVLWNYHRGVYA